MTICNKVDKPLVVCYVMASITKLRKCGSTDLSYLGQWKKIANVRRFHTKNAIFK